MPPFSASVTNLSHVYLCHIWKCAELIEATTLHAVLSADVSDLVWILGGIVSNVRLLNVSQTVNFGAVPDWSLTTKLSSEWKVIGWLFEYRISEATKFLWSPLLATSPFRTAESWVVHISGGKIPISFPSNISKILSLDELETALCLALTCQHCA